MTCLGNLSPSFVTGPAYGIVDESDPSEMDSWELVWNQYYDRIAVPPPRSNRNNQLSPPDNWNQHFAAAKRIARYGLMFTPVEENGEGPFQLRKYEVNGETNYSAKFIRTGETIESPGHLKEDGRTPMSYMISAYIPQAVEDCVTVIGFVHGKGQFSGITGYETVRIPMGQVSRKKQWLDVVDQENYSWFDADTEGAKVNPEVDDELSWYKADRKDLQTGSEPRIIPHYRQKKLANTALRNTWFPACGVAVKTITNSDRGTKKTKSRFNKLLLRLKMFKAAVPVKNDTNYFDKLEDQVFITSVELFNNCKQDFHEGFFEEEGSMNDIEDACKLECLSNSILDYMINAERNGWPV